MQKLRPDHEGNTWTFGPELYGRIASGLYRLCEGCTSHRYNAIMQKQTKNYDDEKDNAANRRKNCAPS